jgi:hypothetical protein
MTKSDKGFLKPDPAVLALVSQGQQRQQLAHLPKNQQRKVKREREKVARRSRVMYDLPKDVIDGIAAIADQLGTTSSQVAAFALSQLLAQVNDHEIDLRTYLKPIQNPRYDHALEYPVEWGPPKSNIFDI